MLNLISPLSFYPFLICLLGNLKYMQLTLYFYGPYSLWYFRMILPEDRHDTVTQTVDMYLNTIRSHEESYVSNVFLLPIPPSSTRLCLCYFTTHPNICSLYCPTWSNNPYKLNFKAPPHAFMPKGWQCLQSSAFLLYWILNG